MPQILAATEFENKAVFGTWTVSLGDFGGVGTLAQEGYGIFSL